MGHTLRGAVTAWLALIALQTVVTNSGQASGALGAINTMIQRLLSPGGPTAAWFQVANAGAGGAGIDWSTVTGSPFLNSLGNLPHG
jgi:hypothetical protein